MSQQLGPNEYNSAQLAINVMILEMNDIEFQRVENSRQERSMQKRQSIETEDIQSRYEPEIKLIRNEMRNSDDKTSNEYFELMSELEELEETRDAAIKAVENETSDKEKFYEIQDTNLETQYNAVKADKEGLEAAQESNLKR